MLTPDKLAAGATVAIMLADGFEEVEVLTVTDALRRVGVRSDLIPVTGARHVTSSHSTRAVTDLIFENVDLSTYIVFFLPGGMPGTLGLKSMPATQAEVLRRFDAARPIVVICATLLIPSELGILDNRHVTTNPAFVKAIAKGGVIIRESPVVIDEQIITSRGASTSLGLSLEIVRLLLGDDVVGEVARGVMLTR